MNAFDDACAVEASAMPELLRFLEMHSDGGRYVLTAKGRLSEFLQRSVGDALIQHAGEAWGVEFKIEDRYTGNLFLETWSNRARGKTGWMYTLDTDMLLYYFRDAQRLFTLYFPPLKAWAFGCGSDEDGRIYGYREKKQGKYDQRNDTWGRIVPLRDLAAVVRMREWNFRTGAESDFADLELFASVPGWRQAAAP